MDVVVVSGGGARALYALNQSKRRTVELAAAADAPIHANRYANAVVHHSTGRRTEMESEGIREREIHGFINPRSYIIIVYGWDVHTRGRPADTIVVGFGIQLSDFVPALFYEE